MKLQRLLCSTQAVIVWSNYLYDIYFVYCISHLEGQLDHESGNSVWWDAFVYVYIVTTIVDGDGDDVQTKYSSFSSST